MPSVINHNLSLDCQTPWVFREEVVFEKLKGILMFFKLYHISHTYYFNIAEAYSLY